MCRQYILATNNQAIESRFAIPPQAITIENNYNIFPGQEVPVITDEKPHEIQLFKFGLTPFWAKSEMNLFNARAEGDYNHDDNPKFSGAKGIILKKAFRKPIRSQRCLVIASAFIEGPSIMGLNKPYLIYLRKHHNPFALAGIWDTWLNPQTGFKENSFAIITTTANSLVRQIGNTRMPVIFDYSEAKKWINPNTDLSRITAMLKHYDSGLMNAYPITQRIKDLSENDKQLIQPIGDRLLNEEQPVVRLPYTSGYYHSRKSLRDHDPFVPYTEKSLINKTK